MLKFSGRVLCAGVFALLAFVVVLTTCDIGLGSMVNTEVPVISLPNQINPCRLHDQPMVRRSGS